jgi:hypothetical protein
MSTYLARARKRADFRNTPLASPTTWQICLRTVAGAASQTGTTITEPSTGGYARLEVPNGSSYWTDAANDGDTDNVSQLQWTNTASTAWVIVGISLVDKDTQQVWYWGDYAAPKTIGMNDTHSINSGDLDIVFANS